MADCKARGSKSKTVQWGGLSNSNKYSCLALLQKFWSLLHKFHHSPNPFLHVVYFSVFSLAAFFILHTVGLGLFFNAFWHQACLLSSHVSLLQGIPPFLNLHCICYLWHKNSTIEFDPYGWLQRCYFVAINTYCMYMKSEHIWKDFMGSFFTDMIKSRTRMENRIANRMAQFH